MVRAWMVGVQAILATAAGAAQLGEWTSQDVGSVTIPGTAKYNEEAMIWTVRGAGADIYGVTDSFQYVCRPLEGDGFIIARVESIDKPDAWAKCGVMIRESTNAGSRFAAVYATPGNGVCFQARVNTSGAATSDSTVGTKEQKALKVPVWIKLERREDQFYGYYATDKAGTAWIPMAWKPPAIVMSGTVSIGLAVCSHTAGAACETRFSNVVVSEGEQIADVEALTNPKEALGKAYQNLERLGNWRENAETTRKHKNLIASSLFVIARARELGGEPAGTVLPDYYRITQLFPDSPFAIDAFVQIALLDGEEGLEYAVKRLETKSGKDKDRFYVAVMEGYGSKPETRAREVAIELFVGHVGKTSGFTLLEQAIANLGNNAQAASVCKSLIQHGMAQPSNEQTAVVGLRYMALKSNKGQASVRIEELAQWVAAQFRDTKVATCAAAILADTHYEQRRYVEAVEAFRSGFFLGNPSEPKTVEDIESILASYRANTLLQSTLDLGRIYEALSQKAAGLGLSVVALHCQRKIAETQGLSLDDFERSAQEGVKYSASSPKNEIWFWKGLVAAGAEDLGTAAVAYERFLREDGQSVLAARACYDMARAKMAIGEDAKEWITKAKALSPCEAVIQLERRFSARVSSQG